LSKTAIADAMKMSRNQLYLILGEKQPVTPDTAVRLAAAVGGSPRMWLNMQGAYDDPEPSGLGVAHVVRLGG
jgi:addiction module HigA family antidote